MTMNSIVYEQPVQSIIWAAQQGDKDAITKLCRNYKPLISKYASARPIACEADDMASELWIIFLKALQEYDLNGSVPFSGFVKSRISYGQYNVFKKWRNRWQQEITGLDGTTSNNETGSTATAGLSLEDVLTPAPAAESVYMTRQNKDLLCKAFSRLMPLQQQLLHDYYFKHRTLEEIGRTLNISRQAVHKHKNRALTALYVYMTEGGI
ncbi:MAG: sigma-70 family RNA polymerase sigma factor [Veillonella sp.]|uniref:RNA polymerase sigma factor n=1 Tax=Veillonella sp. TaxID=1926307 RepID=UPI0025F7B5EF|nr:sigma-70 family RNA polymerase sigma factor [Veillonella sp.]MBS4912795.1 sigma-70 family RNA polymerase sigma factor [Veillonella sp.]